MGMLHPCNLPFFSSHTPPPPPKKKKTLWGEVVSCALVKCKQCLTTCELHRMWFPPTVSIGRYATDV